MCRFYSTREGGYTRLCYRTGRRGERVSGNVIPEGKHHVVGSGRRTTRTVEVERCKKCECVWHVKRYGPICDNCLTQPTTGPPKAGRWH